LLACSWNHQSTFWSITTIVCGLIKCQPDLIISFQSLELPYYHPSRRSSQQSSSSLTFKISAIVAQSGSNMATLLLSCGALVSERIRKRRRERRNDEEEYNRRFEEFKSENERWEIRRQSYYSSHHGSQSSGPDNELNQDQSINDPVFKTQPPSYEFAINSPQTHTNAAREQRPIANVQQSTTLSLRQLIATKDIQPRDKNHW
jgi:hypothetical protein